jgi:hypothetical protein
VISLIGVSQNNSSPSHFLFKAYDLFSRIRRRQIEFLITIADSFQQEDLPLRDPVTGNLTMTGYNAG